MRWKLPYEVFLARVRGGLEDELFLLRSLTTSRRTALDIGANRGFYSYFMSKYFAHVVAFEPNVALTERLAEWNPGNLVIHNCALSSSNTTADLYIPIVDGAEATGWASFDKNNLPGCETHRVLPVEVSHLDDFGLKDVSLIKIDVEGHELEVLQGGEDIIGKNRPTIIIEVKEKNRRDVSAYFERLGYRAYRVAGRQLIPLNDTIIGYHGTEENFVLKPDS